MRGDHVRTFVVTSLASFVLLVPTCAAAQDDPAPPPLTQIRFDARSGTVLERRRVGEEDWQPVCAAPCTFDLAASDDGAYRVRGVRAPVPVVMEHAPGHLVRVHYDDRRPFKFGVFAAGGFIALIGLSLICLGLLDKTIHAPFATTAEIAQDDAKASDKIAVGLPALLVGAGVILGGAFVKEEVVSVERWGVRPLPPRARAAPLLRLTF
jgi:hypothetical protein